MKRRKGDNPLGENYVARIVAAMKATGNRPGIIQQWLEASAAWALANPGPDAEAIKAWLPHWQVRPFYSAEELAPMFPALAVVFGHSKQRPHEWAPNRLTNMLDFLALPFIIHKGRSYYIVERIHDWSDLFRNGTPEKIEQEISNAFAA